MNLNKLMLSPRSFKREKVKRKTTTKNMNNNNKKEKKETYLGACRGCYQDINNLMFINCCDPP